MPDGEFLARAFSVASARYAALRLAHVVEVPELAAEIGVADAYADGGDESGLGRPADASAAVDLLMLARPHRGLRHSVRLGRTPRAVLGVSDTPVEAVPLKREPATAPLVLESEGEILKS